MNLYIKLLYLQLDMEDIVKKIVNEWRDIIESIQVDNWSRKVESINYFRMENTDDNCYKVNFNFPLDYGELFHSSLTDSERQLRMEKWNLHLEKTFIKIFSEGVNDYNKDNSVLINAIQFNNDKVDYMNNQGYRFIVQFYPMGFIKQLRQDKLKEIGI
jgi:hypothetical protein